MKLRPLILAILEDGPFYGYEIVQRAKRHGQLRWEEGTIYPLLHKMEQEDLLRAKWRKAQNGKDRKYYEITRKGKAVLIRARSDWKQQVRLISSILLGGQHGYEAGKP